MFAFALLALGLAACVVEDNLGDDYKTDVTQTKNDTKSTATPLVVGLFTGAYAIKYSVGDGNDTKETPTLLPLGEWKAGEIMPETDVDWYTFLAFNDRTYTLTWDDHDSFCSGSYTCDIKVSAFRDDGITILNSINKIDGGYGRLSQKIHDYSGGVYIKVECGNQYALDKTGTYAIKVVDE